MQLPSAEVARGLAQQLRDSGYTVEGVRALLGAIASDALDRNTSVPARRVLTDDRSRLSLLTQLFLLGDSISKAEAESSLGTLSVLDGLLVADGERVRAILELAPYAADRSDWFIASDWSSGRTGRPVAADHVLGVGGASTMLAQCTVRPEVSRALDVGTGCGVQAFHLAQHASQVVATDISERCLAVARFNAALNGIDLEMRMGSLYSPVAEERFDLIVSNPPFVIASPKAQRHDYRDSGMAGDEVCGELVHESAARLTEGGWCQLLANWEIAEGDDWASRPRSWVEESPLDAWVVQRDVADPAAYVESWLRDAGGHQRSDYNEVYSTWLDALDSRGVLGIGFGLVNLRLGGHDQPIRSFQHAPQPLVQPVGPDIRSWFAAQDRLIEYEGDEVLRYPWRCASDVEIIEETVPGASQARARSVHRRTGFAWSGPIDEFGVAMLARADGQTPIGAVLAALAAEIGLQPEDVLSSAVPIVRQLVAEGFLYLSE